MEASAQSEQDPVLQELKTTELFEVRGQCRSRARELGQLWLGLSQDCPRRCLL